MKKLHVMKKVSAARRSCEIANACLRSTANRLNTIAVERASGEMMRSSTEEERRLAIIDAWVWMHDATQRAHEAQNVILAFAKQNGITLEEIDRRCAELRRG